jgi:hypothetical protein
MGSTSNPVTVPPPRYALCNGQQLFYWSDNATFFSGFILIELVPPAGWTQVFYGNLYPALPLPKFQRIPILYGQMNTGCGVFYNEDLTPPGSNYIAWYYDATGTLVAGPTQPFTVSSGAMVNSFTPPILTLPIPTTPGTPVQPD